MFSILKIVLLFLAASSLEACQEVEQRFRFDNSDIYIRLVRSTKLNYQLMRGTQVLLTMSMENFETKNNFVKTAPNIYTLSNGRSSVDFQLNQRDLAGAHITVSQKNIGDRIQPMDCVSLDIGQTHWYAGPEDRHQYWPIERHIFSNYPYLTKEDHNAAISERYWLNSKGTFIYVDNETPLFIEQNSPGYENKLCFRANLTLPYNRRSRETNFIYHIGFGRNAKTAHMYAIRQFLNHPHDYPDERMVKYPIWSTWALYKAEITDSIVREFAQKILDYGFNNSQIEIDDDWEDCYGALTFRKNKFPNTKRLTDDLHRKGFRVTLWIHPFINKNCTAIYNEAKSRGYLVADYNGNTDTKWWNSKPNDAAYIDFTKSEVRDWFSRRLKRLQTEDGIDSFKFDAGETSWTPQDPVLQGNAAYSPNQITTDYVRLMSTFGSMVEVRSGQNTQDLPIFVRMLDKDSNWGWNNGLVTLITTLLQMNLNGYPFVLPDMIGGNGYNNMPPTKELFLRWLQANVFMPSLQFSYVPWNFENWSGGDAIEISKKFTALHAQYTPYIMKRFRLAAETGEPVNAPIWWLDPNDQVAQSIFDQFTLGDDIIAAPVVEEGATVRDIYLPIGDWVDGNTNQLYKGPMWLMQYPAPLDVLPFFVRRDALVGLDF